MKVKLAHTLSPLLATGLVLLLAAPAVARIPSHSHIAAPVPIAERVEGVARQSAAWLTRQIALAAAVAVPEPHSSAPAQPARPVRRIPGLPVAAPTGTASYNVFGSRVIPAGTLPAFAQWSRLRATIFTAPSRICQQGLCTNAVGRHLAKRARTAATLPVPMALEVVNRAVNETIGYAAESGDHWAALAETASSGAGDCEDFALAKMALLYRIGVPQEALQLVVLKHTERQIHHAVLAVHHDGKRYILDNLSDAVKTDAGFESYLPIASFAGQKSFIHGFAADDPRTVALGGTLSTVRPGSGI